MRSWRIANELTPRWGLVRVFAVHYGAERPGTMLASGQGMKPERASVQVATVLLVDDTIANTHIAALSLEASGFRVETASSAAEALRIALARPPDLIVSDVLMSDLDGFGLCRRIRSEPSLAHIPVLLVSAHFQERADRELAERVGASGLIARTPSFESELAAVYEALASAETVREFSPVDTSLYERHISCNAHTMSRLAHEVEISRERYRTLIDNANDSISVLDLHWRILEVNQRTQQMHGRTAEEMIGRHVTEFAPPGDEFLLASALSELAKHKRYKAVLPMLRSDGRSILVDYSASLITVDGESLVMFIGRDVTESRRVADALADAESRYRRLVDRIPDVVWITDGSFCTTFVTPNVTRLGGFSPEEVYAGGRDFWIERVHPDDRAQVEAAGTLLATDGVLYDLEFRWRHRNGHWLWLWNRAIGVSHTDGKLQFEGVVSDITERRKLGEQLRMSQKMEAIGQLTGGIAHDFNNILAVILANTALLKDELGPHDSRRESVDDIHSASTRAVTLIRQLLAFSRTQVLEPKLLKLDEIVVGTEKMLRRLIGADIELCVTRSECLATIRADAGQIEQVIMNLAVNARDAMPSGGRISIDCANVEIDTAYVAGHVPMKPGPYVMMAVSDTGSGIDAETKKRIFEPFFTTKAQGKGTGLGLSTCYGIVKQSGGYIWVYSEPGHGTVFKIYLPAVTGTPAAAAVRSASPVSYHGTETVLVIEDDTSLRSVVGRMLEGFGYQVLAAANGDEARKIAEQQGANVQLVLSDIVMPGANGPDSVALLAPHCPRAKVLFMSGYTDQTVLQRGLVDTTTNFLQKPFTPEALGKKVRTMLDG